MKYLFTLFGFLLSTLLFSQKKVDTLNTNQGIQIYTNWKTIHKKYYSIKIPRNWKANNDFLKRDIYISPTSNTLKDSIYVIVRDSTNDLDSLIKQTLNKVDLNDSETFIEIAAKRKSFDGKSEYFEIRYLKKINAKTIFYKKYFYIRNRKIIEIVLTVLKANYNLIEYIDTNVFDSFRINSN